LSIRLLDVNVLVALAWPAQESHSLVRTWFAGIREEGWATCSVTQGGLVRVLSTPALKTNLKPAAAIRILEESTRDPFHHFWTEEPGFLPLVVPFADRLQGHRQVTDAFLLALAIRNQGRLATLDRGILALARSPEEHSALEVLGSI
jgi:toxin-antitoxin system PIN domain toxin